MRADRVVFAGARRLVLFCVLTSACTQSRPPAEPSPAARLDPPSVRLFLVGDAGGDERNPVLTALATAIASDPASSLTVFLGDNVYPDGLPDSVAPDRARAEQRLRAQIDAVRGGGRSALGMFVTGNHDWGRDRSAGPAALIRQAEFVNREGAPSVVMMPAGGCPGPSVTDVADALRVVLLETEWWLRRPRERVPLGAGCLTSEDAVLDSLRRAIAGAGARRVVVVGHHPLVSYGPHGGHVGWQQHLFPLREIWGPLWLPLPLLGSIYPLALRLTRSAQDLPSPPYARFRSALASVLRERPPLAYASGHEHNLQVLRDSSARLLLVSGAGSRGRPSFVAPGDAALFTRRANGFMRLDIWGDGHAMLVVLTVDPDGSVCECYRLQVD